ncbi:MAG: organic solute transporter Ostalpha-domain-containing protein, partial [Piptocephalis tieghemiana]
VGWGVSAAAALVAYAVSIFLVFKHAQYYTEPNQQRYIIRIILMVPIYAIISWLSYYFYTYSVYFALIRDSYEALVLASFLILLLQYLGKSPIAQRRALSAHKDKVKIAFPFCFLSYHPSNPHFLQYIKYGILQYVVIRPICTIVAVIMHATHIYCPHSYHLNHGHFWIVLVQTTSVTISMYAVIQFYITVKEDIAAYRPLYKFLCVKTIIFITFWQEIFISILGSAGLIKETDYWTKDNIANGLSSFLACLEMVIFAIIYHKAFGYRPYRPADRKRQGIGRALMDSMNLLDLVKEIVYGCKYLWWMIVGGRRPLGADGGGRVATMDIQSVMESRVRDYEMSIHSRRSTIIDPNKPPSYSPHYMTTRDEDRHTVPEEASTANRRYLTLEHGLGSPGYEKR